MNEQPTPDPRLITCITALKRCAAKFRQYRAHHQEKGDIAKYEANDQMVKLCEKAIAKATGGTA